jgi:hypothetical protein
VRYPVLTLVALATSITFFYYRRFFLRMNKEDASYKQFSRWIISLVLPFFLLIVFGILGILQIFTEPISPYLFVFFSCTIIFSILLRPKSLNTSPVIVN